MSLTKKQPQPNLHLPERTGTYTWQELARRCQPYLLLSPPLPRPRPPHHLTG
ncbi:hypothetical protein J6590_008720 [Homalodisca vitripennis]|nr:hypothetical protein J6590_008720 [Homalodisca vitripennis]